MSVAPTSPIIPDDITLAQCGAVYGVGSPICAIYKKPKEYHELSVKFLNPFNFNTRDFAFRVKGVVEQVAIPLWSAATGSHFETTGYSYSSGEIKIGINEYGNRAPLIVWAIVAAVLAATTGLIIYAISIVRGQEIILKNIEIVQQLRDQVTKGIITQDQAAAEEERLFPDGITDKDTDEPFAGLGGSLGTITAIIPLFIGLMLLSSVKDIGRRT